MAVKQPWRSLVNVRQVLTDYRTTFTTKQRTPKRAYFARDTLVLTTISLILFSAHLLVAFSAWFWYEPFSSTTRTKARPRIFVELNSLPSPYIWYARSMQYTTYISFLAYTLSPLKYISWFIKQVGSRSRCYMKLISYCEISILMQQLSVWKLHWKVVYRISRNLFRLQCVKLIWTFVSVNAHSTGLSIQ